MVEELATVDEALEEVDRLLAGLTALREFLLGLKASEGKALLRDNFGKAFGTRPQYAAAILLADWTIPE